MSTLQSMSIGFVALDKGLDLQDRHEHGKPDLLCAKQRVGVGSPFSKLDVVGVAQDDEGPCGL